MVPSLGNMILLGHIVNILEENSDLHLVIDSPSSGHMISLFESLNTWKNIFQTGVLTNDIEHMLDFLSREENLEVNIVTLPSEMSIEESCELKQTLASKLTVEPKIILNNLLSKSDFLLNQNEIPLFLENKIKIEEQILMELLPTGTYAYTSHHVDKDYQQIVLSLASELSK